MIGPAQQNGEAIASWIFGVVLVGDGRVALQPVLRCKTSKLFREAAVHLGPVFHQICSSGQYLVRPVRLRDEHRVKLWMQSLTDTENGVHRIVDSCHVAE